MNNLILSPTETTGSIFYPKSDFVVIMSGVISGDWHLQIGDAERVITRYDGEPSSYQIVRAAITSLSDADLQKFYLSSNGQSAEFYEKIVLPRDSFEYLKDETVIKIGDAHTFTLSADVIRSVIGTTGYAKYALTGATTGAQGESEVSVLYTGTFNRTNKAVPGAADGLIYVVGQQVQFSGIDINNADSETDLIAGGDTILIAGDKLIFGGSVFTVTSAILNTSGVKNKHTLNGSWDKQFGNLGLPAQGQPMTVRIERTVHRDILEDETFDVSWAGGSDAVRDTELVAYHDDKFESGKSVKIFKGGRNIAYRLDGGDIGAKAVWMYLYSQSFDPLIVSLD